MVNFILTILLMGAHGEDWIGLVAAWQSKLLIDSSPTFGHACTGVSSQTKVLDQVVIYRTTAEPLSPARSVALKRDKLMQELSTVNTPAVEVESLQRVGDGV